MLGRPLLNLQVIVEHFLKLDTIDNVIANIKCKEQFQELCNAYLYGRHRGRGGRPVRGRRGRRAAGAVLRRRGELEAGRGGGGVCRRRRHCRSG